MIYVILAVFLTAMIVMWRIKGITVRQALYLFIIVFCIGTVIRAILFALGM